VNATTLDVARGLANEGHRVAALNFESAKNPGGGFLIGARAQEETLARASGLHAMLQGDPGSNVIRKTMSLILNSRPRYRS
jgi:uncharacterized protein (TIGR02452 family)